MKFAVICRDKPRHAEIRAANRDAHLAYARETGSVVFGGPFLDEAGGMTGSLLILDVPDMDAARKWTEDDPYAKAGLFASVSIDPWKQTVGS
jgi:uncharacterized protein YciI